MSATADKKEVDKLLAELSTALQQRRADDAYALAEKALKISDDPRTKCLAGAAAEACKKWEEAEGHYAEAVYHPGCAPAIASRATKGLFDVVTTSTKNYSKLLEVLNAQKSKATNPLVRCKYDARIASVLYSMVDLETCISTLRGLTSQLNKIISPPPSPLPFEELPSSPLSAPAAHGSGSTSIGGSGIGEEELKQALTLQLLATRALVDVEEARLLDGAVDQFGMRMWSFGKSTLQAQREWIMCLDKYQRGEKADTAPSPELCAWIQKHVQFAADRVKVLLFLPVDARCETDRVGVVDKACNSHAGTVYEAYRLASAKLEDVGIFALRILLPGFQARECTKADAEDVPIDRPAAFVASFASTAWATLQECTRNAVRACCELVLTHAWPNLSNATARALVEALDKVSILHSSPSPIQSIASKLLSLAADSPPLDPSERPQHGASAAYVGSLIDAAEAVRSQWESWATYVPQRSLWLVSSVSSIWQAVGRSSHSFADRKVSNEQAIKVISATQKYTCSSRGVTKPTASVLPGVSADIWCESASSAVSEKASAIDLQGTDASAVCFPRQAAINRFSEQAPNQRSLYQLFAISSACDICLDDAQEKVMPSWLVDAIREWLPYLTRMRLEDPPRAALFAATSELRLKSAATRSLLCKVLQTASSNFYDGFTQLVIPDTNSLLADLLRELDDCNALFHAWGSMVGEACRSTPNFGTIVALGQRINQDLTTIQAFVAVGRFAQACVVAEQLLQDRQAIRPGVDAEGVAADITQHVVGLFPVSHAVLLRNGVTSSFSGLRLDGFYLAEILLTAARASWLARSSSMPSISDRLVEASLFRPGCPRVFAQYGLYLASPAGSHLRIELMDIVASPMPATTGSKYEGLVAALPTLETPQCHPTKAALRDQMRKLWKQACEYQPDNAIAASALCDFFMSRGDRAHAEKVLIAALRANPMQRWARVRQGAIYLHLASEKLHQAQLHRVAATAAVNAPVQPHAPDVSKQPTHSLLHFSRDIKGSSIESSSSNDDNQLQTLIDKQNGLALQLEEAAGRDIGEAITAYRKALSTVSGILSPTAIFIDMDFGEGVGTTMANERVYFPSSVDTLVRSWYGLAHAYKLQGKLSASVEACTTALEVCCMTKQAHPLLCSALSLLGDCLQNIQEHEEAIRVFSAVLARRPYDPATLYAVACSFRSLARRCIGDGIIGQGISYILEGLTAGVRCLQLLRPRSNYEPFVVDPASGGATANVLDELYAIICDGSVDYVPFPLWKVLGDLLSIVYDANPNIFGLWALACSAGFPEALGEALCHDAPPADTSMLKSLPRLDFSRHHPVRNWLGLGKRDSRFPTVVLDDELWQRAAGHQSSNIAGCHGRLSACSAFLSAACYAMYADSVGAASAGKTAALQPIFKQMGVAPEPSGSLRTTLSGALCDLARVCFLQYQSIVYACGSTGAAMFGAALSKTKDKSSLPMLALRYAAYQRMLSVLAHRAAAATTPASARAWNGLGVTEFHAMRAQHALIRSVQLDGGGIALVNLAGLYMQSGCWGLCPSVLSQAQTKDPNNTAMWLEVGLQGESAVRLRMAEVDNKAGAAFLAASDLALHPAAIVPAIYHMVQGGTSSFEWNTRTALRLAIAQPELLAFARMATEKDPMNPAAWLAAARVRAISAVFATYSHMMIFTGNGIFPRVIMDLDVLLCLALPFCATQRTCRLPDVCGMQQSTNKGVFAAWSACLQAYDRVHALVAKMLELLQSPASPNAIGHDSQLSKVLTESRCLMAYAAVVRCTFSNAEGSWSEAAALAAATVGVRLGTRNGWSSELHDAMMASLTSTEPQYLPGSEALAGYVMYACALALGDQPKLAIELLYTYHLNAHTPHHKRTAMCAIARLVNTHPSLTAIADAAPVSIMQLASVGTELDAPWLAHSMELAGVNFDSAKQEELHEMLLRLNPTMSWTATLLLAWAAHGSRAGQLGLEILDKYIDGHPSTILPWVTKARICAARAKEHTSGSSGEAKYRRSAQQAAARAEVNLYGWIQEKHFTSGNLQDSGSPSRCIEDDIIMATSVGSAWVQGAVAEVMMEISERPVELSYSPMLMLQRLREQAGRGT